MSDFDYADLERAMRDLTDKMPESNKTTKTTQKPRKIITKGIYIDSLQKKKPRPVAKKPTPKPKTPLRPAQKTPSTPKKPKTAQNPYIIPGVSVPKRPLGGGSAKATPTTTTAKEDIISSTKNIYSSKLPTKIKKSKKLKNPTKKKRLLPFRIDWLLVLIIFLIVVLVGSIAAVAFLILS